MEANRVTKIVQWNANGIRQRKEFIQYLYDNEIEIACIQETQLKSQNKYDIKGYNIIRKDRCSEKKGGGVATLIRESIPFTEKSTPSDLEAIHITVEHGNNAINIINLYNPPGTSTPIEYLEKTIIKNSTILLGDFNAHHKEWTSATTDPNGAALEKLTEEQDLILIILNQHT